MATKKAVESSANDPALEKLLVGVNPKKPISEKKFQQILDHYNSRNPDKAAALTGVKYFIHRTFPRIDGRRTQRKYGYIEKVDCVAIGAGGASDVEEVSELPSDLRAWITARHGGGRYQVRVNDANHNSESQEVALTSVKVDEIEVPPILNPAELVDTDQETMNWITRQLQLGLLMRLGEPPNVSYAYPGDKTAKANAAPSGENAGLAQVAMEAMKQRTDTTGDHAARRAIDLVADTAKRQIDAAGPGAQRDTVGEFKAMAEVLADSQKGSGDLMPLLITMITENNKAQIAAAERQANAQAENFKMQMEMMKMQMEVMRGRGKDPDEMSKLEKMMELASKMGGGDSWGQTIKEMMPLVLPFLMRGMGGPAPAAAPAAEQLPAGTPSGVAGAQPGARMSPAQVEDFATRALTCMNRGQDGSDFANGIEVIFSPGAYDTLRAMGKDNLIGVLLQSTKAAAFQEKGQATAQFIDEFIGYGDPQNEAPPTAPPAGEPAKAAA
jgi:hypothetical protein